MFTVFMALKDTFGCEKMRVCLIGPEMVKSNADPEIKVKLKRLNLGETRLGDRVPHEKQGTVSPSHEGRLHKHTSSRSTTPNYRRRYNVGRWYAAELRQRTCQCALLF